MLESRYLARRTSALPASASAGPVAIHPLPAASRWSLRTKVVEAHPSPRRGEVEPGAAAVGSGEGTSAAEYPHPGGAGRLLDLSPPGREVTAALALPINRCAVAGERLAARLGPDEWLLIGAEDDGEALATEAAAALAGRSHALVDISHRNVAIAVEGERAADVLNAGCPLDLHPSRFPPGAATRTLLGKAEIVLMRPGQAPVFRVECWRSFATYVHGFLVEAARDV